MSKKCELYDRECINCHECDICDLDSSRICNNCGKCLDDIEEFRTLNIEQFMIENEQDEELKKYKKKK